MLTAQILRDRDTNAPILFKHGAGLWSSTPADDSDDIVELAFLVDSSPEYAWKWPVSRRMIDELGWEWIENHYAARSVQSTELRLQTPTPQPEG